LAAAVKRSTRIEEMKDASSERCNMTVPSAGGALLIQKPARKERI